MKKIVCAVVLLFVSYSVFPQYFAWAKRAGLWAFDLGYGIGTDNAGNVYISGKYELKGASFGTATVGCAGNHDIYLAKYNSAGTFQWVRTAGGPGGDYSHCMAVDASGNSYIAGEIEQTVSFGNGVSLTSNGDNDVFIAKYNTNGSLIWARKLGGGTRSDKGLGICISGNYLYVTGKFEGTANFAGTTVTGAGAAEMFIAKYSTDGVFQWVKRAGGTGNDEGYAVSADPAGNCYVTGYFSGTANFSGLSLSSYGSSDIFIAKYNPSGSILWVKKAGGTSADYGHGISVDNNYGVYVTGGFRVKSTFGTNTLTAQRGDADIFVARYDANGNNVWVRKGTGKINDYGRAIATDNNNLYITGNYGLSVAFGTYTLTGTDSTEIYFASYDKNGNFRWALKAGGDYDKSDPGRFIEMGLSIATDPYGNVVGSGAYRSTSTFGAYTLKPFEHTDVYVAKITQASTAGTKRELSITPSDSVSFCNGAGVTFATAQDSGTSYFWMRNNDVIKDAVGKSYRATQPGMYSVMAVSGNDTVISPATKVTMTNKIEAQINSPSKIFCRDSNLVLKASVGEENIYRWKRNGRFIQGASTATFQPQRTGDYQVKIIQGSCFDWSPVTHVQVKDCSSDSVISKIMTDYNQDQKEDSVLITIYPNPNNGLFTLEINMAQLQKQTPEVKVEIINAIGQVVYSKVVPFSNGYISHHIELGNSVSPGIYIMHITAGESIEKNRLMLIR
jgi:hypothetical protein